MNILERAEKYANGKANEAITKAISEAYIEGYKAGYKDREEEIPMDYRDNKTEYVDLGLPSRTLWSTDYEKDGKRIIFFPYGNAECMKLPTKEQWEELNDLCRWEWGSEYNNGHRDELIKCIGPNGHVITFRKTGLITGERKFLNNVYFWIDCNKKDDMKDAVNLYINDNFSRVSKIICTQFSGYKLPVRSVR